MRIHKKPRFFTKLFHWFTLVELIVVISVLAVLASIAMSQVSNITAWARDSQRMTDMSAMKSSIELYKAKTGKLPIPTNGSWVTYSWALLWTQGTFGEPTWRQLNSITPKPVDPNNSIEYVYSVANNNREFELGGILEKATGYFPNLFPELLAASQNVTFIEGTYNGVSLKVETGSKTYVVAAPSLIGGYLGDAKMENTGLTIEWLWSLPKGFSGVVVSTAQTGTFTPIIAWSGAKLPDTSTGAEAMIIGLQSAYTGTVATSLSQISSLVSATGSQITALGEGLVENALGGDITGQSSSGEEIVAYCENPTVVTTYAGNGSIGFVDGPWATAQFSNLQWIDIDDAGNLYVGDVLNHRIRKIANDANHTVSTIAGNGTVWFADGAGLTVATFNRPTGIGLNKETSEIIVVEWTGNRIRKIANDANRTVSTIAGSTSGYNDGTGSLALFFYPMGIVLDADKNIFISESNGHRIRKIANDTNRTVSTIAGNGTAWATDGNVGTSQVGAPYDIAIDSGWNIYVADTVNNRIRKIANNGSWTMSTLAGSTTGFADGNGTSARFAWPKGIAIDKNGNLYVADATNNRIRKIANDTNRTVSTIAGNGTAGFWNGTGTLATFSTPIWIEIDKNGNLYVADQGNNVIRKISCQ